MNQPKTLVSQLTAKIATLAASEVLVETNAGTYSDVQAHRAIGVGDPQFANYKIYECVGTGARRIVGCDPAKAPGYGRGMGGTELNEKRHLLAGLRSKLRNAKK